MALEAFYLKMEVIAAESAETARGEPSFDLKLSPSSDCQTEPFLSFVQKRFSSL